MGMLDRFRDKPEPKPDRRPFSAPGRAHTVGFLELEELNPDLVANLGLRIFDKMYRTDGDVRQAVALVTNPIMAGTWDIQPHGGPEADEAAQDDAKFVEWALWDCMEPNLNGHLEEMLPILLRSGFVPFEELWTTATWDKDSKDYLVLRKLDLRLPRTIYRWFQDVYGDLHSIVQQLPVPMSDIAINAGGPNTSTLRTASNGEALMPGEVELLTRNIAYYRIGREGDNWEGVSMLRPAYKHWLLKDAIERIDAIAQEREAVGIPICYPPLSATPRQLDEMENVLAGMRSNEQGYIITPGPKAGQGAQDGQGWLIEILGFDRTGSGRDPMPSLTYHTSKIYASVIAEFMRLGHHQEGARATAQVQADPFLQSIEALSRGIEIQLQRLVDKLIAYNRPNAKQAPKIRLSKIDATSLTQLADYVMKLSQAGALLPDKALESYLRLRADLPPMDPEAVKKRKDDVQSRTDVLTGGGAFGDAPGGNTPGGGAGKSAPKSSSKTKPKKSLAADFVDAQGRRLRYRAYRPEEEITNLDAIEDNLDSLPDVFAQEMQDQIVSGKVSAKSLTSLLEDVHSYGMNDAREEASTLLNGGVLLSYRDSGVKGMTELAKHGVMEITNRMSTAREAARINHGDNSEVEQQLAVETEGLRALRAVALGHGSTAYQQGRHDMLKTLAMDHMELGFIYSSMLDSRVCDHCLEADDGIVRRANDPVRLDKIPPNRHCLSNLSGHNYCRCIEIPTII